MSKPKVCQTDNRVAWADYSRAEQLGYQRGYYAGSKRYWPMHVPPSPPEPILAELFDAARKLRDAVDTELAGLSEDDEWQTTLGDPMDKLDDAFEKIGEWLVSSGPENPEHT